MQVILPQIEVVSGICGMQKSSSERLRLSNHCLRLVVDDGELLYNVMTGELLLLPSLGPTGLSIDEETRKQLAERWFLVPESFDEHQLAQQVKTVTSLYASHGTSKAHYIVFPTSDCNARCFYCYELGRPRRTMSDDTAHDVAEFILRHASGRDIRFHWFGGEPLYNYHAIDIIIDDIAAAGAHYSSQMTTNASLFNEDLVRHAFETWKLDSVQVTLDGTEDIYNNAKAYIDIEGSAYQRVLQNIGYLADTGMKVAIRLNLNRENEKDLLRLADDLAEHFGRRSNVTAYTALLRDFGSSVFMHERMDEALESYRRLQEHLFDLGIGLKQYPRRSVSKNQCMADSDDALAILPDGRVGKCEHESEDKLIGSIYDDAFDDEAIRKWKQCVEVPECSSCLFFPTCVRLKNCAWHEAGCTSDDRSIMQTMLELQMLNAYKRYRSGEEVTNETEDITLPVY